MPTFQYSARDRHGVVSHGTVDADSNAVAARLLREQGLWVTGLQPVGAAGAPEGRVVLPLDAWWTGVSLKDLAIFFRQFATMVNAGMPLARCLSLLQQQSSSARLRQVAADLFAQAQAGGPLAVAFRRHPAVFRPLIVAMVDAGETGGFLDRMLFRIAEYLEREHEIRQQLKRRTLYPKILIAAGILIPPAPVLVLQGIVPYLRVVLATLLPVALVLVGVWFLFRLLLQFEGFRASYDTVKIAIPVLGTMARQGAVGKLFRGLAALYGAGVPVSRGLRLAAGACDNRAIGRAVLRQAPRVERGERLSQVLAGTRLLPPMVIGMVVTGEESGDMEAMLEKVADYQEREAEHRMRQVAVVLPVIIYLVVAIILAVQIIGAYGGYIGKLSEIGAE
jgi:type IV pilus assembly protein PilC